MALPPGGPQGDYVSQTQYATQQMKERQNTPPQQAVERQDERPMPDQESAKLTLQEKIAMENERNQNKNNASRVEQLGITPLSEKAQAAYEAKAQQMATEQKQEQSQGRAQEQESSRDMDFSR